MLQCKVEKRILKETKEDTMISPTRLDSYLDRYDSDGLSSALRNDSSRIACCDPFGHSLLHALVIRFPEQGNFSENFGTLMTMLHILIEFNIDPTIKTQDGYTAKSLATHMKKSKELINALNAYEKKWDRTHQQNKILSGNGTECVKRRYTIQFQNNNASSQDYLSPKFYQQFF
jgi:hypothetical protein